MASMFLLNVSIVLFKLLTSGTSGLNINETSTGYCNIVANSFLKCINIIPTNLSSGISSVLLLNPNVTHSYNYKLFDGTNWGNITYLEMVNNNTDPQKYLLFTTTFHKLKSLTMLTELHIHMKYDYIYIDRNAFVGLNHLETLNLNGCTKVEMSDLGDALSDQNNLPNLKHLHISGINAVLRLKFNSSFDFFKAILHKKLHSLEISSLDLVFNFDAPLFKSVTRMLKFDACSLEFLNVSRTNLLNLMDMAGSCTNLTNLDVSYTRATIKYLSILVLNLKGIRNSKILNISGSLLPSTESETVLKTITDNEYITLHTIVLHGYLATAVMMKCQTLEVLELADNGISFISSEFTTCHSNLTSVNLANNKLGRMAYEHCFNFSTLFKPLIKLTTINLSSNKLRSIPLALFEFNLNLQVIDLSSNMLDQVLNMFGNLHYLATLNFANNNIKTLGRTSMEFIESMPKGFRMNINKNTIDCLKCENYDLLKWIVSTTAVNQDGLTCLVAHDIRDSMLSGFNSVHGMCEKENAIRLIIDCSIVFGISIVITISTFCVIRRMRKKQQYKRQTEEIKLKIRNTNMFAVFLMYSSYDMDFVHDNVYNNLNNILKGAIGTERDIVCEGDKHFRPGKPIPDEVSELLDNSAVVVAVISNRYCQSVHCRNEFYQAFLKEKPIVLMLKGNIDLENMTGCMKDLFEKNTRILWTFQDGNYNLNTTWENVCESILSLIDVRCLR